MKKLLSVLLTAAMALSLVACAGKGPSTQSGSTSGDVPLTMIYTSDIETLDYVSTSKSINNEKFRDMIDGLYENDQWGNMIPALAEGNPEVNEDATQFVVKLKKGTKWVTATGEEFGEVKAEDFLTGLQHAADFESEVINLVQGSLLNLDEYMKKQKPFSEVGLKALDDYTLQFTFNQPIPYFQSMLLYNIFLPINKTFLESKGEGCKLGEPNKEKCEFGKVQPDGILYNGPFILAAADSKSRISLKKNASYWDAGNVHFSEVKYLYDDGKDPYSVIKGFEQGIYPSAALSPRWKDIDDYKAKYAKNYTITLPNATVFAVNFNFNRRSFKYSEKTPAEHKRTQEALLNVNVRKAFIHAYDRVAYLKQSMPEDVAISSVRNMNTFPEIVKMSDGSTYGAAVSATYRKLTGTDISLADGQDPFLSKEKALEAIEAAKKDGIKFPISLDLGYINNDSEVYVNRARSIKTSVEANTDGNIIINLFGIEKDAFYKANFLFNDVKEADYDINTFSGWGPDYADPKTFSDTYSIVNGDLLRLQGLDFKGVDPANDEILKKLGYFEYQEMLDKADAIKTDLDARYQAYAEADAFLISKSINFPSQMQVRGYRVTRLKPFSASYGEIGIMNGRLKFVELQPDLVTRDQYNEAYSQWTAKVNGK